MQQNNNNAPTPGPSNSNNTQYFAACSTAIVITVTLQSLNAFLAEVKPTMVRQITVNTPEGPNNGLLLSVPDKDPSKPNKTLIVSYTKNSEGQTVWKNTTEVVSPKPNMVDPNVLNVNEEHAYALPIGPSAPTRDADDIFVTMEELPDLSNLYKEVIECPLPGCDLVGPNNALDFHYISAHACLDFTDEDEP